MELYYQAALQYARRAARRVRDRRREALPARRAHALLRQGARARAVPHRARGRAVERHGGVRQPAPRAGRRARSRSSSTCRAATRPRKRGRIRTTTRRCSAACTRSRSTGRGRARATCAAYASPRTTTRRPRARRSAISRKRPEVDPKKIGVYALSFGSLLGHAHRGEGAPHRRGSGAVGVVRRQVLPHDRGVAALQAALRLSHAVLDRGRARQGVGGDDDGRAHGQDPVPDAARCRRIRSARADRGGATACSTR